MGGEKNEKPPSWRSSLFDFTQDTTLHGIRLITAETAFVIRRFFWVLFVLAAFGGFGYIIYLQLTEYLKFKTIVNVEVVQTNKLTYPAVSVCNQNYFRRSPAFELGVYDQINEGFLGSKANEACGTKAFTHIRDKYIRAPIGHLERFNAVSLEVCKEVCVQTRGTTCNSIMYNRMNRTCYISSLTLRSGFPEASSDAMFMATRNTCAATANIILTCTFEDEEEYEEGCTLYQEVGKGGATGRWVSYWGPTSTPKTGPLHDHTTYAGTYMYLEATYNHGLQAALKTPYLNIPDGHPYCLRMYHSMVGDENHFGNIKVRRRETNYMSKVLGIWQTSTPDMWSMIMVPLGSGLFTVEIWGQVGNGSRGDMAIDDVQIGKCEAFKKNCLESLKGSEYLGYNTSSSSGASCVRWDSVLTAVQAEKKGFIFPEVNISLAKNYCRNPNRAQKPWCYTATDGTKESCNIQYCPCKSNQFTCYSGQCISNEFVCDTVPNCADGSDENAQTAGCLISVSCTFDSTTICGYSEESEEPGEAKWKRHSRQMANDYITTDAEDDLNGFYAYIDSGNFALKPWRKVWLLSPMYKPILNSNAADMCLSLYYYISAFYDASSIDKDQYGMQSTYNLVGRINVYRQDSEYVRTPLWTIYPDFETYYWTNVTIRVPGTVNNHNILFEGVLPLSYGSDMAIDSVSYEPCTQDADVTSCASGYTRCDNGRCVLSTKVCDSKNDCFDNSDEYNCTGVSVNCTFTNAFLCGYVDDSNPMEFMFGLSSTGSGVTVTEPDVGRGIIKKLVSPWTTIDEASCLLLVVDLQGNRCEIEIRLQKKTSEEVVSRIKEQGSNTHGFILGSHTEQVRFVYAVTCQQPEDLTVTFTSIDLSPGACVLPQGTSAFINSASCNFTGSNDCDFTDRSDSSEQSWAPAALGMVAQNIEEDIYAETPPAEMESPEFEITSTKCLAFHLSVDMPEVSARPGELFVERVQETGPPPREDEEWHAQFQLGFKGNVIGFFELSPGQMICSFQAQVPYGGLIYLAYVAMADGECEPTCDDGMFLCSREIPMCIPDTLKCDTIFDCYDGQDEEEENCQNEPNNSGTGVDVGSGTLGPSGLPNSDDCTCPTTSKRRRRRSISEPAQKTCSQCPGDNQEDVLPDLGVLDVPQHLWPRDIAENLTYAYTHLGHQKKDMIFYCDWQGQLCDMESIRTDILDYGLCHTFNIIEKPFLETSNTGSSNGLRMILNIEEYEYMRGPQDDAGVKMFVYNQSEIPFVRDLGFAIGPGVHALAATTYTQSLALGHPWGNCSNVETYSECKRRCETKQLIDDCQCRDAYMNITVRADEWGAPDLYLKKPECDLSDYLWCVVKKKNGTSTSTTCDCDEPCFGGAYAPALSYAQLSTSTVDKLNALGLPSVRPRVVKAKEIEQRTIPDQYLNDLKLLKQLMDDFTEFTTYVNSSIYDPQRSFLTSVPKAHVKLLNAYVLPDLETAMDSLDDSLEFYNKEYSTLEKSTIAVLGRLTASLYSFIISFENDEGFLAGDLTNVFITMHSLGTLLEKHINMPQTPESPRDIFGKDEDCKIHELLQDGIELANNIQQLEQAEPSPPAKRRKKREIEPEPPEDETSPEFFEYTIKHSFDVFSERATEMERCMSLCSELLWSAKRWYESTNITIGAEIPKLRSYAKVETVTNSLDFFGEYTEILEFQDVLRDAYKGYISGDWTLQEIADIFSEETIEGLATEFKQFLDRLNFELYTYKGLTEDVNEMVISAYTDLCRYLMNLGLFYGKEVFLQKAQALNIWKTPVSTVEDPTNPSVSESLRIDDLEEFVKTQSAKIISGIVNGYSSEISYELMNLYGDFDQMSSRLMTTVRSARTHYETFKKETSVDHDFVKNNFIAVDVFFAQLKYIKIAQDEAYKLADFFASVGGYMGLFIGASCLTVMEIIDFFCYNCCLRMAYRKKTAPEKDPDSPSNYRSNGKALGALTPVGS